MRNSQVTSLQALQLKRLGYKGKCEKYVLAKNIRGKYVNVPVPSVDQAIDWIRIKYEIVIFNKFEPYVDPIKNGKKQQILYGLGVKFCDTKSGWNFRKTIGKTKCSPNLYAEKREAISIALKYIERNNLKKVRG